MSLTEIGGAKNAQKRVTEQSKNLKIDFDF